MRKLVMGLMVAATIAACSFGETRELTLDGPPTLRTDALGVVEGPKVLLSDGEAPDGITWTVAPDGVATVEGGVVTAVGAGEATVTAEWQGQSVSWKLVVDPQVRLRLLDPPAELAVGKRQPLHVEARIGDAVVDPGEVSWRSTATDVLTIAPSGEVQAKSPGVAYVIVSHGDSEAMAEITVTAAE